MSKNYWIRAMIFFLVKGCAEHSYIQHLLQHHRTSYFYCTTLLHAALYWWPQLTSRGKVSTSGSTCHLWGRGFPAQVLGSNWKAHSFMYMDMNVFHDSHHKYLSCLHHVSFTKPCSTTCTTLIPESRSVVKFMQQKHFGLVKIMKRYFPFMKQSWNLIYKNSLC